MLRAIQAAIAGLVGPFMILNFGGGILAAIWLLLLGQWTAVLFGVVIGAIAPFALGLLLLPSTFLTMAAAALAEKQSKRGVALVGGLSSSYVVLVMTVWCVGVLITFSRLADPQSWFPMLLWSYGVALGPWAWMAQKDVQGGGGESSIIAVFFAEVGYVLMVLAGILFGTTLGTAAAIFGGVMLLAVALQLSFVLSMMTERPSGVRDSGNEHQAPHSDLERIAQLAQRLGLLAWNQLKRQEGSRVGEISRVVMFLGDATFLVRWDRGRLEIEPREDIKRPSFPNMAMLEQPHPPMLEMSRATGEYPFRIPYSCSAGMLVL